MADNTVVVGVFAERVLADQAIHDLQEAGFQDIGFIVRDDASTQALPEVSIDADDDAAADANEVHVHQDHRTAAGLVAGSLVGGVVGVAAALLIPGVGPAIAGGILTTLLGGIALGAATGGMIGAFMDLGIPEEAARHYEGEFLSGRTIVIVQADERPLVAFNLIQNHQPTYSSNHLHDDWRDPEATVEMNVLKS